MILTAVLWGLMISCSSATMKDLVRVGSFCSHFHNLSNTIFTVTMSSFANSCFYFTHAQLRKMSRLVVGHLFDATKDVVVVTGGSSGLGKAIASKFAEKDTKVVILDIDVPQESERIPSANYFRCDVGDIGDVQSCYSLIVESVGVPTVLVNNAGITSGKTVLALSSDEIERIIRVNLLLSFFTIKTFLPGMLQQKRGYVITVGSVLGYMSPAYLSAYGASKSGLVALHELLTYELGPPLLCLTGVKTLLVCPGQMRTSMFDGVATPWRWLAPELKPLYVARSIVEAITHGRRGEIKLPLYGHFLPVFRALPWPIVELARHFSGIDESMLTFQRLEPDQVGP